MRKLLFTCIFFASVSFVNAQQPKATPQEICEATQGFLNALNKSGNLSKALGQVYQKNTVAGMEMREYHSLQAFPLSIRTIIVDTNRINRVRFVKVLMFTETRKEMRASQDIQKLFDVYTRLFKDCLVPQKFEEDESQLGSLHEIVMTYRFTLPSTSNNPFDLPSALLAQIYIDHTKNEDGTFTNELSFSFKKI